MEDGAEIRVYRESDRESVLSLWSQVFPGGAPWNDSDKVISTKLTVQPELFFVAIREDHVVGTIVAGFDGVRGWVHRLAVRPDQRRQRLATKLMQQAEIGLAKLGCPKLNLQVRESNLEVLKFYQSLGYAVEQRASLGKALSIT